MTKLGFTWPDIDFNAAEVRIRWQLQRAGHQLRHRETKIPFSTAPDLPPRRRAVYATG